MPFERIRDVGFLSDDIEPFVGEWRTGDAVPFAIYDAGPGQYALDAINVGRIGVYGLAELESVLRQRIITQGFNPDSAERNRATFFATNPDLIDSASTAALTFQHQEYIDNAQALPAPSLATGGAGIGLLVLAGLAALTWKGGR